MSETPPPPLEWHPAYRDMTGLIDFLHDDTRHHWRVPIIPRIRAKYLTDDDNDIPLAPVFETRVLTKQRAWGPAPYVGDPFVYLWPVATDELGRSIAGESSIEYMPPDHPECLAQDLRASKGREW